MDMATFTDMAKFNPRVRVYKGSVVGATPHPSESISLRILKREFTAEMLKDSVAVHSFIHPRNFVVSTVSPASFDIARVITFWN